MATYATVQTIVSRLIRLSGQVPGTGVQIYSQDVFLDMVNTVMRMAVRKFWWPHLMKTFNTTLDGVTGVVTMPLSGIADHTDIRSIFVDNARDALVWLGDEQNQLQYAGSSSPVGYTALSFDDPQYATRVIQFLPITAKGNVVIRARIMPGVLGINDVVPIDQDLIVFGVLWSYFEDEGDNPRQASKYKALFDAKYSELISAMSTHRVSLTGNANGPGSWQETY